MQLSTLFELPLTTPKCISSFGRLEQKKVKYPVSTTDHWKQSSKLIPDYLHMYPRLFIHLLSKAIPCHRRHIEQCLTSSDLLQFMQQRAQLLCTFFQLKIEQDYWNFVSDSIVPVVAWLSEAATENIMKQNSINWDHTKTETNIKYRQNIVENKLQQTTHDLYAHIQQPVPHPSSSSCEHPMSILFDALTVLVRNGLHHFLFNFQQKKILLNIDFHDVELVKSFYNLNPSEEQVSIDLIDVCFPHFSRSFYIMPS
jgi:hypothetical protein